MLVKEVGIYPPGTLVKLASDEVGVVFKRGATAKTPTVMALLSAKGRPLGEAESRDTADPRHVIVSTMSLDKSLVAIDFEHIWCGKRRAAAVA
jgi:hypothetical protein